jgi:hypothetical protein
MVEEAPAVLHEFFREPTRFLNYLLNSKFQGVATNKRVYGGRQRQKTA